MAKPNACLSYGVVLQGDDLDSLPCEPYALDDWLRDTAGKQSPIASILLDWDEYRLLVAVKSSLTHNDWESDTDPVMSVSEADLRAAAEFCAKHGIPFVDAKWRLVAYETA